VRCEVCGRKIHNDPIRANIEGAKLTVCAECAKHGKIIYPDEEVSCTYIALPNDFIGLRFRFNLCQSFNSNGSR
jgi:NAD-dependent SIR2 family protein deacetylase